MDDDFEIELAKLYNEERKKEYYYLESVEQERQAIVMAFYDHYAAVSDFQEVQSVEDFLGKLLHEESAEAPSEEDDFMTPITEELNRLIQADIEKHDVLLGGEMHVGGEGIYMHIDNDGNNEVEVIENGSTITGDVSWYAVAPMIPYEAFMRMQRGDDSGEPDFEDLPMDMPGLWLLMNNIAINDENGIQTGTLEQAMVPLSYPTMTFNKVIRQKDAVMEKVESEEVHLPVATHFKSDFMLEVCNDIENDLNHNDYDSQEAHDIRASHQSELGIYMTIVTREDFLKVTAFNAIMLDGNETELEAEQVRYMDPVIMKINDTWRVLHAFEVITKDGGFNVAHILPEHLLQILELDQE